MYNLLFCIRYFFLFVFIIVHINSIYAEQFTIDSLENKLKIAGNYEKVEILNELAKSYLEISLEKSLGYANTALELAIKQDNKKQHAIALRNLGRIYCYKSIFNTSLEYHNKSLEIFEELESKNDIARTLNNIGLVYDNSCEYGKALEYYKKSLKIYKNTGNQLGISRTSNYIGIIYHNISNYEKAIEYYYISLKTDEIAGNNKGLAISFSNIGTVYKRWGKYEKALEYYKKSLEIFNIIDDKKAIASVLNNIGTNFYEQDNYDKALEYYFKALKIKEEFGDMQSLAITLRNIGLAYFSLVNYNKALEYSHKALEIDNTLNNKKGQANVLNHFGAIYKQLKNYRKATKYYNRSLQISKSYNFKEITCENYSGLSEVSVAIGEHQRALEYYKLYNHLKDSIFNIASLEKISEIQTGYEIEKKESKIRLLEKNQKIQELKFDKEKRIRNTFTIAFVLVSVFIFILLYLYIQKQKAYKIIVKHNIELAKKDIEFEKIGYSANIQKKTEINNKQDKNKYSGSVLSENQKQKLLQDIILLMEEEKYFLNPQFTVEDCANELQTNRRYISQVINEYLETNFNNFVNEYRVKETRKFLVNPEFDNYSLNGIASMVGFHSRATFNSAFKKFTGLTPSYFKKKNG